MMTTRMLVLTTLILMATSPSKRHRVVMSQFQFEPRVIEVSAGDTIVWENQDIVPHTARADDGAWDTGNMPAKSKHITVAKKKGEHAFTCLYHSNMKGKLVVR